jgi:hypothetical protein
MPEIEVATETEGHNHWSYRVRVREGGRGYEYHVTLSWSDYDLWSKGRVAPERVIRAAFQFLLEREPASSILSKFDCALIRRYFSEVDRLLPRMV